MGEVGHSIAKGVKWTGISSATNAIVKLVQVSVLAHILSPDAFGLIAIAYICLSFGDIIVDMGLTTAILHFQNISPRQYSSIFWVNIIVGFLTSAIIFMSSWIVADYYKNPEIKYIVEWLSLNIFILSISRLHKTFLQKHLQFKIMAIIEMISSIVMFVSAIALAELGFKVYSLVYSTIVSSVILTILFVILTPSLNSQISLNISFKSIKNFYAIGIYQFLSSFVEFFSRETDTMFISTYFSTELLGYYSLCKQLTQRLYNVINPIIVKVAVPILAKLQDQKDVLSSLFSKMIRFTSSINFPIYTVLFILSPTVLYYLYGPSYLTQVETLRIFSIYYAFISIGSFTGVLTVTLGNTRIGLIWSIYRVVSMIIICFISKDLPYIFYIFNITIGVTLINYYIGYRMTIQKFIPLSFSSYLGSQLLPLGIAVISGLCIYFIFGDTNLSIPISLLKAVGTMIIYLSISLVLNRPFTNYFLQYVKR